MVLLSPFLPFPHLDLPFLHRAPATSPAVLNYATPRRSPFCQRYDYFMSTNLPARRVTLYMYGTPPPLPHGFGRTLNDIKRRRRKAITALLIDRTTLRSSRTATAILQPQFFSFPPPHNHLRLQPKTLVTLLAFYVPKPSWTVYVFYKIRSTGRFVIDFFISIQLTPGGFEVEDFG